MSSMFTVDDAKKWAEENSEALDQSRLAYEDDTVQLFNRIMPDKSKELWDSGNWIAAQLRTAGATDEHIKSVQFAAGQRSVGRDAWVTSVAYVNEFLATGENQEKPGPELADKINAERFAPKNSSREVGS